MDLIVTVLRAIGRFLFVAVLASTAISLLGRIVSDFDEPAENDPHDLIRAIGVIIVALLISGLNEVRLHRKARTQSKGG